MTERFLQFLFSHQTLLIEILFALILGICTLWLFSHMQGDDSSSSSTNAEDIERAMEKVLERTQGNLAKQIDLDPAVAKAVTKVAPGSVGPAAAAGGPTATAPSASGVVVGGATGAAVSVAAPASATASGATAAGAPAAPTAAQLAELSKLKAENDAKNAKLQELEKALTDAQAAAQAAAKNAAAAPQGPAVNVDEFQKKIRELESRLNEYEIIEDDIANLSLYKEENTRLKNELQKVKGAPAPAAAATTAAPAPTPTSAAETPAAAAPVSEAAPTAAPATEEAFNKIDPDKLVSEAAELAAKPVSEAPPQEEKDGGQKLIEEFENFMKDAGR